MAYPQPIQQLIQALKNLPSVGEKTAERYVFHLLKSGKKEAGEIALALKKLLENVESCQQCWDFTDQSLCRICRDKTRNQAKICVVAEPQDKRALEQVEKYNGVYHILRGTIDPEKEETKDYIKLKKLFKRLRNKEISEIILGLNHDLDGETTMMYIERQIKKMSLSIKVTRLARGLPMGSDLQYADKITLDSAFKNRIENKNGPKNRN
jgi:recombination protein RecR